MTGSARALLQVLAVSAGLAQASDIHPAPREEWSGTYRCGTRLKDPEQGSAYSAQVKLVLNHGVATITRQSARVKETMTGKVGADGRVTLEGGGVMKDDGGRWRYRFDGRFEDNKFEARGAMLSASGASKIRECTMALARVSASGGKSVHQAASSDKQVAPSPPTAVASEPAAMPSAGSMATESPSPASGIEPPAAGAAAPGPITATPDMAQRPAAVEPPPAADVPAAPAATEDKKENRPVKYSREDRGLLALFVGMAAAGIGLLLYDWRRPSWLTPRNAVAAVVATALGTAGIAFYALSHLNL